MSDKQCFVCGSSATHALEEHHIIPESLGGPDTDQNTEWLCSNCHSAISSMYSRWFFAELWQLYEQRDTPPRLVRQNPPLGLQYNEDHELVPDPEDNFSGVVKAVQLVDTDLSNYDIADRTGVSPQTARRLRKDDDHRARYEQYIDDSNKIPELQDWCDASSDD